MRTLHKFLGESEPPKVKTQICRECQIDKPLTEYGKSNVFRMNANGTLRDNEYIQHWRVCKDCRKKTKLPEKIRKLYRKPLELNCPICHKVVKEKSIHLDHCHKTQEIRGYVCMDCNVGMGHLGIERQSPEETREIFERILKWIEPSKNKIVL